MNKLTIHKKSDNSKHDFKGLICGLISNSLLIISALIFIAPYFDMISFDTLEDGFRFLLVVLPLMLFSVSLTGIILGIFTIKYNAFILGGIGVVLNSIVFVFSLILPQLAMG